MAKRNFNYTENVQLKSDNCKLVVYEKSGSKFEVSLTLDDEKVSLWPDDALVYVDVYGTGLQTKRVNMGPLKDQDGEKRQLVSGYDLIDVLFRVRIIEPGPERRLLGWRDRISTVQYDRSGNKVKGILPVKPVDLGDIIWKLNWDKGIMDPVLHINKNINTGQDITSIAGRDSDFLALVFPEALRQILTRILMDESLDHDDDENNWLVFAGKQTVLSRPNEEEFEDRADFFTKVDEWVEDVVQQFSADIGVFDRYTQFKNQGD